MHVEDLLGTSLKTFNISVVESTVLCLLLGWQYVMCIYTATDVTKLTLTYSTLKCTAKLTVGCIVKCPNCLQVKDVSCLAKNLIHTTIQSERHQRANRVLHAFDQGCMRTNLISWRQTLNFQGAR